MEEDFDDYANIYNLVDGWLGCLGTGTVEFRDDDGKQDGLYPPRADIRVMESDRTEMVVVLRFSESKHSLDTEVRFRFPDGVKVTTTVDGFHIEGFSDIGFYRKMVVEPVSDMLPGHKD